MQSTSISGFYCKVCNIEFSNSFAMAAHQASLKHKKKTGELAEEMRVYKKDADVTAADVMALVERKAAELELRRWSELRINDA